MIQDFILEATPARARRLLSMAQACAIDLPESVVELAAQDLIDLPGESPQMIATIQKIMDCGLRGTVAVPDIDGRLAVIRHLLRLTTYDVVIVSDENWSGLRPEGFTVSSRLSDEPRIMLAAESDFRNKDFIDARRSNILLLLTSFSNGAAYSDYYGRPAVLAHTIEFEKTLFIPVINDGKSITSPRNRIKTMFLFLTETLFPGSYAGYLDTSSPNEMKSLKSCGFKTDNSHWLYFFNIVTDLIKDDQEDRPEDHG